MSIIDATALSKTFRVPLKEPGLGGTLRHFFHRTYRTIDAVSDVTFSIAPGEVVGFLGPNGAGKTTTLKMLSGLIHPSAGRLRVGGAVPFERKKAFLKSISLVMGQKEQLMWDLPALDALRINAAVYEIPETEFKRRMGELAEMLAITDKLTQPIRKLSLGERMKAELLAALLHRPQLLFLDEPTLGLDITAQSAIRDFLRQYNKQYGATILLTSHYMADITALCERVLLIHQGRLIYDGALHTLSEKFAPHREVRLELERPATADELGYYGKVESVDGRDARLLIERTHLTARVAQLLADLPVLDLRISEPPIEDVVSCIFETGEVR